MANNSSFAKVAEDCNSILMRDNCIKLSQRTLNDCCQRWGNAVHQDVLQQTYYILVESGFAPDTQLASCTNECDIHEMKAKIQKILDVFIQNHSNFPDITDALS